MLYNIGSLIAPVIAMYVATKMDNMRAPFLLMCGILIICMAYFFNQKLVAAEKNVRPPRVPTTIRRIIRNLILFFRRSNMRHAYMANYGFYAIASLRSLYVPLAIISAGFSKETVGIVLSLGIIPFILIEPWIASLATKHGAKRYLILGYLTYTVFAFLASASTGFTLLGFFIIWQFSNACVEPIKEIPFFDITTKPEQSRFFGIFKTSSYVAKIITPLFASLAIYLTGSLASVWIVAGIFGIIPAYFVYKIQPKIK